MSVFWNKFRPTPEDLAYSLYNHSVKTNKVDKQSNFVDVEYRALTDYEKARLKQRLCR